MNAIAPRPTMDDALLQYEIEQFLYGEAALIDDRRFEEWLECLAKDLEYWMPVRSNRAADDQASEFSKIGEVAYFDDDKDSMVQRVRKLRTGFAWAEDPPSRTRHLVDNVRILERHSENELTIGCNVIVYRSRLARDEDLWVGRREDRLRRHDGRWLIVKRHVYLDQVSLASKNLSIFF